MWRFLQLVMQLALASLVCGLKFEVPANSKPVPRCVRDFVTRNTMVVANIKTSGYAGDGQSMDVIIKDNKGNSFAYKKNVVDSVRMAFTAHDDAAFDICFENTLNPHQAGPKWREVELDVEIGANARDWNAVQAAEKLKPAELELRRIEELTDEILAEMEYLKSREARLRNTNESTNQRVKNFSVGIVLALIGLGGWQIWYLRAYFRSKHII